jgi:hypothetical protein
MGRLEATATKHDLYVALALTVRDRLFEHTVESMEDYGGERPSGCLSLRIVFAWAAPREQLTYLISASPRRRATRCAGLATISCGAAARALELLIASRYLTAELLDEKIVSDRSSDHSAGN